MTSRTLFKQICIALSWGCSMLNMIPFGEAVIEKTIVYAFPYISICKSLSPWGGVIYDPRDFI